MCIILACKAGYRPAEDVIERSFDYNHDGAGFMWADGSTVHIRKGFMTLADYLDALDNIPDNVPLVLHMRIGTSGGDGPEVTHPYPVTSDLDALHALDLTAPVGIAHNGVLPGYGGFIAPGVSDTVAFVACDVTRIARMRTVLKHGGLAQSTRAAKDLRRLSDGSRLAVLDAAGHMLLTGDGWETVTPGVQASNSSWRPVERYACGRGMGRGWYGFYDNAPRRYVDDRTSVLVSLDFEEWSRAALADAADLLDVPTWAERYYERSECARCCSDYAECRHTCATTGGAPYCALLDDVEACA